MWLLLLTLCAGTIAYQPDWASIDKRPIPLCDVPVGTVQRYNEWKSGNASVMEVVDVCDIIGVNLYPFYSDIDYDRNIEVFENQLGNTTAALSDFLDNGGTLWITETGYPSGGTDSCNSEQEVSVDNEETYFNNMKDWAADNTDETVFYFAYFDKETEEEQDGICNNFLGLADAYGTLKFSISDDA